MGWYFNNLVMRMRMPRRRLSLLPSGTASNESLHHEINDSFKNIQTMHQATLRLKLLMLSMGKQMAHFNAMHWPTTRQLDQQTVLARASVQPWWSEDSWHAWCLGLKADDRSRPNKAVLAMQPERQRQRALVSGAVKKRPAHQTRKRTPFTLKREGFLIQSGVRRSIYKGALQRPATASVRKRPASADVQ